MDPCHDFYQFSCGGLERILNDSVPIVTLSDTDTIDSENLMEMGIIKDVLGRYQHIFVSYIVT